MYDLEEERVAGEIRRRGAKRVLVQLPDGLRPTAFTLAKTLTRLTGAEMLLSGDSCYGACDVALSQAEAVGADLIVHYGHSGMLEETGTHVLYVHAKMDFDVDSLVETALPLVESWRRIGLAATVQHVHKLGEVAESLRRAGHEAIIGPGNGRTPQDGQILGCDYHTAQAIADGVDGYIFIGGGRFHPLGLAAATGKPVVVADPYLMSSETIRDKDIMRLAKRRMAAIDAAKEARRLGIVVSLKPGQYQPDAAESLRNRLEEAGYETVIICLDEVGAAQLGDFTEADAFVITACPRIALDGLADIGKPLLTMNEAQIVLGEKRWEQVWGRSYFG